MDVDSQNAVIKVVGVGGGGGNAVNHMLKSAIEGVDFICANTDAQALSNSQVKTALQIGSSLTKGLGAGANPNIGHQAAMEDKEIQQAAFPDLKGADLIQMTIDYATSPIHPGAVKYFEEVGYKVPSNLK